MRPHESRSLRRHRILMLGLAVALSCAGACDWESPRTTVQRRSESETHSERLRVKTWAHRARFECLESTTGPCLVTVYTSHCNLDGPADLGPACRPLALHRYRLAVGEARQAMALPSGFRWCMQHGIAGAPTCRRG